MGADDNRRPPIIWATQVVLALCALLWCMAVAIAVSRPDLSVARAAVVVSPACAFVLLFLAGWRSLAA